MAAVEVGACISCLPQVPQRPFLMGGDATRVPVIPAPPAGPEEQQLGDQTNIPYGQAVHKATTLCPFTSLAGHAR